VGIGVSLVGCRAVITGASAGLGAEFARQLAESAEALMLVARRGDVLEALRSELVVGRPGLRVDLVCCDIATAGGRERVIQAIRDSAFPPTLLVNNAGVGDYGTVQSADADRLSAQVDLNISAVVLLTHAMLPLLVRTASKPAGILNIGSLAGTIPLPGAAVYAASKAFVASFSEALRIELGTQDVVVTVACPGPTPTGFRHVARRTGGADTDRSGDGILELPPVEVVRQSLRAIAAGRAAVFPGWAPTLAGWFFRVCPRAVLRWFLGRRFRRGE
jgi:short-subunit dehydrogenase